MGSVKNIHFEQFTLDMEGSNTWRHKQAGSELVVARGLRRRVFSSCKNWAWIRFELF